MAGFEIITVGQLETGDVFAEHDPDLTDAELEDSDWMLLLSTKSPDLDPFWRRGLRVQYSSDGEILDILFGNEGKIIRKVAT